MDITENKKRLENANIQYCVGTNIKNLHNSKGTDVVQQETGKDAISGSEEKIVTILS